MKNLAWLCIASLSLFTAPAAGIASPGMLTEESGNVEVGGKLLRGSKGKSNFLLSVGFAADTNLAFGEALLVYAEPSHTLLFAHVNTRGRHPQVIEEDMTLEKALSRAYGPVGRTFKHLLSLPYDPRLQADSRVEVLMRSAGRTALLASGAVNVEDFAFTTSFSALTLPDGSLDFIGGTHCCSGVICGQMCVTCAGAFFTCDLIGCSINCEYF